MNLLDNRCIKGETEMTKIARSLQAALSRRKNSLYVWYLYHQI